MNEAEQEDTQADDIGALYDFTVADRTNVYRFVTFGQVNPAEAARVFQATGLRIAGFTHIVDTSAVRHIVNQHGGPKEVLRGQVSITRTDVLRLPAIVGTPERIENGGKTKQGRDTIRYYKRVNGEEMVYLEEVRTKWRRLAPVTLRKTRAAREETEAVSPTPDAPS